MTRSGRNFLEVSLPATSRDSIHPDKTGNRKGSTLHTEETELMNDKLPPCADTRVERVRLKDGDYFFPAEPAIKRILCGQNRSFIVLTTPILLILIPACY
jgi:hypothetical protein